MRDASSQLIKYPTMIPPQDSHNRISHHVSHIDSMHYVFTATSRATSTPPKNEPIPIEPPPHHLGLEDGKIHLSLGESMHVSSPKHKINHEISTTLFQEDEEFFEATTRFS
jgi:hypothetical protein